jgi:hypothetical protein
MRMRAGGVKHKRKIKNEEGQEEEQVQYFYGYKAHVSLNAANHLITSLEVTSGVDWALPSRPFSRRSCSI